MNKAHITIEDGNVIEIDIIGDVDVTVVEYGRKFDDGDLVSRANDGSLYRAYTVNKSVSLARYWKGAEDQKIEIKAEVVRGLDD